MRKIREVLRLYFAAALSIRAIARSLGTSPSTVGDYLRRAKVAGLSWPVPESVDDTGLERRLFPEPPPSRTARPCRGSALRPTCTRSTRQLRYPPPTCCERALPEPRRTSTPTRTSRTCWPPPRRCAPPIGRPRI